ncbi:hypothetical protein QE152_g37539 [Popillia japonica]|uniref:Fibronectin type-III domain-containing protein n=1 Tax=Popillia japonica TaxID=7064 RepID=A0AAW1I9D1_POPJA
MPRIERCEKISKIVAYSSIILLSIAILAVTILSVLPHLTNKCIEFPYPPSPISFTHYGNGTGEVSWNVYPTDGHYTNVHFW